jgi:hypothetical protein
MLDAGQFFRTAVLAPADGLVAIKHQGGVGATGLDAGFLLLPRVFVFAALGFMEAHAPATTPDSIALDHSAKGGKGGFIQKTSGEI